MSKPFRTNALNIVSTVSLFLLAMITFCATAVAQNSVGLAGASGGQPQWVDQLNSPGLARDQIAPRWSEQIMAVGNQQIWWDIGAVARSYYAHDFRYTFTGMESTFGVEGAIRGECGYRSGNTIGVLVGEIFLNQRFDDNVLTDFGLRRSFANNFDIETFEFSLLSMIIQREHLTLEVGRFVSPFGRYYGLSIQNGLADAPFVRTESILFRETGAQLRWNPGVFRSTLAITNGGSGRDTNSSKAVIGRAGIELERMSFGGSVKWQDGIGSEGQKEFNNHVGLDWMIRLSDSVIISTEVVYDEYGFRKPGIALDDITWGRSLYNRQLHNGLDRPITGLGYYANVIGRMPQYDWMISFGQFHPGSIGDPIHDRVTTRGIGQLAWHVAPGTDWFGTVLIENTVPNAQNNDTRTGLMLSTGLQLKF